MPDSPTAQAAHQIATTAQNCYRTRGQRAAVRGGMMDAASLCDAFRAEIAAAHPGRQGRVASRDDTIVGVSLRGAAMIDAIDLCAAAIMEMRDLIDVRGGTEDGT